jgi:hypothetical protein
VEFEYDPSTYHVGLRGCTAAPKNREKYRENFGPILRTRIFPGHFEIAIEITGRKQGAPQLSRLCG